MYNYSTESYPKLSKIVEFLHKRGGRKLGLSIPWIYIYRDYSPKIKAQPKMDPILRQLHYRKLQYKIC